MNPGNVPCPTPLTSSSTSCTFPGIDGNAYSFSVSASNTTGPGPAFTTPWVTPVPAVTFHGFAQTVGGARDISAGGSQGNPSVWAIAPGTLSGGGYPIYERVGKGWIHVPGAAVTVAVGPDGVPWVLTNAHQIYKRVGNGWALQPGLATSIAIGGTATNPVVWITDVGSPSPGNHGIWKWNGTKWTPESGGGDSIAVGPGGLPWVTTSGNQIYQYTGNAWILRSGAGSNITEGADGAVWIFGLGSAGAGGHPIYFWNGTGWVQKSGAGVSLGVDPNGLPWVTTSNNQIWAPPSS